ncbi:MAG: NAD(P)H-dependent oxidoreductase [Bacteroidales bacterium]|nr:NAD(P)H-dependent oxidoreductase [Bacteroidales bacterium]
MGILASTDPVALDQACLDLVFTHEDSSGDDAKPLQERINRQHGTHITEYAEQIGLGSKKYNIYNIDDMKGKTLVAYFSATGTTAAVAKDLAEVCGATLHEIKPVAKYTAADLDWTDKASRSTIEMGNKESRPAIVKDFSGIGMYDVIFIGFPVWWYTAPTIINTFLETYELSGKTVIFFATSGGSDLQKANADFKAMYPSIKWVDGKTLNGASKSDIKAWAESVLPKN